jgi:hypothetical protein
MLPNCSFVDVSSRASSIDISHIGMVRFSIEGESPVLGLLFSRCQHVLAFRRVGLFGIAALNAW